MHLISTPCLTVLRLPWLIIPSQPSSLLLLQVSQAETERLLAHFVDIELGYRKQKGTYKGNNTPHSLHLLHHHNHAISTCNFITLSGGDLTWFFNQSTLNYLLFVGSFSVVCSFIGYQTRGAAPSNFDVNYAYNLGFAATRLIIDGYSGYMATIGSLREKVEDWQPAGVPITALMAWYVQHIVHTKHYTHSTSNPIRDQYKHMWSVTKMTLTSSPHHYFLHFVYLSAVPLVSFLMNFKILLFCMHHIFHCIRSSSIVIQLHLLYLTSYSPSPPSCLLFCSEIHGQNPVVPKTCVDLAGPAFAALEEMRTTCSVRSIYSALHWSVVSFSFPLLECTSLLPFSSSPFICLSSITITKPESSHVYKWSHILMINLRSDKTGGRQVRESRTPPICRPNWASRCRHQYLDPRILQVHARH